MWPKEKARYRHKEKFFQRQELKIEKGKLEDEIGDLKVEECILLLKNEIRILQRILEKRESDFLETGEYWKNAS